MGRSGSHPKSGTMSGADLRVLRVSELTIHGWDVARAIGADKGLDGELVQWLHDRRDPVRDIIGRSGLYAPQQSHRHSVETAQERLLLMLGRQP